MKRQVLVGLISIVLVSSLLIGCGHTQESRIPANEDTPTWNEKQAIEHLFDYLASEARKVGLTRNSSLLEADFQSTIYDTLLQALNEDKDLGESVDIELASPAGAWSLTTWTSALRRIAS